MKKYILLILFLSLFLVGCYDYKELDELALTTAMGIDYIDEKFILTLQIVDTNKKDKNEFNTVTSYGKTLQGAFRSAIKKTSKKVYGSQINLLLVSENIAQNYIYKILDFFYRDKEFREEFLVAMVKDPKKVLAVKTVLEENNSKYIMELIENSNKKAGILDSTTYNSLLSMYLNKRTDITLPNIIYKDKKIYAGNMTMFNNDKLVYIMTPTESKGYKFLTNTITNVILTIPCKDDYYSLEIKNNKTTRKFVDGAINIQISNISNLTEMHCDMNLGSNKTIKKIEKEIEDTIKEIVLSSVKVAREYNSDIFKFKDYIYKINNKYYRNNKTNIDNIKIKIKVNTNLINKGNGLKVIKYED